MKTLVTFLVVLCAALVMQADDSPLAAVPSKSVVQCVDCMPAHSWMHGWTLTHFQQLNQALARFTSKECGVNTKCFVVPQGAGYTRIWIRSDWEDPISDAQKGKAESIIQSYLSGADCARITKELKAEENAQPAVTAQRP